MEPPASLYEQLLSQQIPLAPSRPARASASIILWRRRGSGVEVFWVERAMSMAFMGGWLAFPGGGLGKRDGELPIHGQPAGLDAGPLDGALPETVLAGQLPLPELAPPSLVAAALRELFEETGLLVVRRRPGSETGLDRPALRSRLAAEATDLATTLNSAGWDLDAGALTYAGRWLTPPLGPMRFDTRFFLLEWPADKTEQPEVDGRELVAGEWIAPGAALARWRNESLLLAPPILHALEVLESGLSIGELRRLRSPDELNLGPFRKVEFRPGIVLLPVRTLTLPPVSHTNAYLIGHGEVVLVDPGTVDDAETERLIAALDVAAERYGRRLRAVWLTHHHRDHTGGAQAIASHFGVPIEAHPDTVTRLAERGLVAAPTLVDGLRTMLVGEPELELEVLHTPGHAKGHIALRSVGENWVVCGDLVSGVGTVVIDPPDGDMTEYLESLERLRQLAPSILFPAHGAVLRNAVGKLEGYIRHRKGREESILKQVESGVEEPAAIVAAVYPDVPASLHPVAERQVLAHLLRLRAMGRIPRLSSSLE